MGYAMCYGPCLCCGQIFGFNPHRVPSMTYNGTREPICKECIPYVNRLRKEKGTEPIVPHKDAYEAIDEGEL